MKKNSPLMPKFVVDDRVPPGTMVLIGRRGEYQTIVHHEGPKRGQAETVEIRPPSIAMITNIGTKK